MYIQSITCTTCYLTPPDNHCQPMAPSTQPPTVHLCRLKGHSNWLDSQTHLIDITHVAQGGSWGASPFCHGTTSLPSSFISPCPLCLHSATPCHLQSPLLHPLHSYSEAYVHSYAASTVRLASDQHQTHLDLVPTPRAAIYIPFLHSSYLPDLLSLTITGNYPFLV